MKRMRDIPRSIKIRGKEWRIHFYKLPFPDEAPNFDVYGWCIPKRRLIYIKMGQTPRERVATRAHELLHAIECEYGISLGHPVIEALEMPLSDLFRQIFAIQRPSKGR